MEVGAGSLQNLEVAGAESGSVVAVLHVRDRGRRGTVPYYLGIKWWLCTNQVVGLKLPTYDFTRFDWK